MSESQKTSPYQPRTGTKEFKRPPLLRSKKSIAEDSRGSPEDVQVSQESESIGLSSDQQSPAGMVPQMSKMIKQPNFLAPQKKGSKQWKSMKKLNISNELLSFQQQNQDPANQYETDSEDVSMDSAVLKYASSSVGGEASYSAPTVNLRGSFEMALKKITPTSDQPSPLSQSISAFFTSLASGLPKSNMDYLLAISSKDIFHMIASVFDRCHSEISKSFNQCRLEHPELNTLEYSYKLQNSRSKALLAIAASVLLRSLQSCQFICRGGEELASKNPAEDDIQASLPWHIFQIIIFTICLVLFLDLFSNNELPVEESCEPVIETIAKPFFKIDLLGSKRKAWANTITVTCILLTVPVVPLYGTQGMIESQVLALVQLFYFISTIVETQQEGFKTLCFSLAYLTIQGCWAMGMQINNYTEFFIFSVVLTLLLNDGFGQAMRSRYLERKLKKYASKLQAEYDETLQNFPQGVIIYEKINTSEEGSSPEVGKRSDLKKPSKGKNGVKINLKFVNKELLKSFKKQNQIPVLMNKKNFRQVMYQVDGSSTIRKKDSQSLKQILKESEANRTLFFEYQASGFEGGEDNDGELAGASILKKRHFEVVIRKTTYESKKSYMIILQDISQVITNQNQKMRSFYQEAMTATISHEQMNPLNSIINIIEHLQNKNKELLLKFVEESETESDECTPDSKMSKGSQLWIGLQNNSESQRQLSKIDEQIEHQEDEDELSKVSARSRVPVTRTDLLMQQEALKIVYSSSMMMKLLNQAMLNKTLIMQDKYTLKTEVIKIPKKILQDFISLFEREIKIKELTCKINDHIGGDLEAVEKLKTKGLKIDVDLYKQILYNVFINACKFNRSQGSIDIIFNVLSCNKRDSLRSGEKVKVITEIKDTGSGMNPAQKSKLFKVFDSISNKSSRLDETISFSKPMHNQNHQTSGQGLGLYLSLQLAQYLNGEIEVDSKIGVGTSVKISFLCEVNQEKKPFMRRASSIATQRMPRKINPQPVLPVVGAPISEEDSKKDDESSEMSAPSTVKRMDSFSRVLQKNPGVSPAPNFLDENTIQDDEDFKRIMKICRNENLSDEKSAASIESKNRKSPQFRFSTNDANKGTRKDSYNNIIVKLQNQIEAESEHSQIMMETEQQKSEDSTVSPKSLIKRSVEPLPRREVAPLRHSSILSFGELVTGVQPNESSERVNEGSQVSATIQRESEAPAQEDEEEYSITSDEDCSNIVHMLETHENESSQQKMLSLLNYRFCPKLPRAPGQLPSPESCSPQRHPNTPSTPARPLNQLALGSGQARETRDRQLERQIDQIQLPEGQVDNPEANRQQEEEKEKEFLEELKFTALKRNIEQSSNSLARSSIHSVNSASKKKKSQFVDREKLQPLIIEHLKTNRSFSIGAQGNELPLPPLMSLGQQSVSPYLKLAQPSNEITSRDSSSKRDISESSRGTSQEKSQDKSQEKSQDPASQMNSQRPTKREGADSLGIEEKKETMSEEKEEEEKLQNLLDLNRKKQVNQESLFLIQEEEELEEMGTHRSKGSFCSKSRRQSMRSKAREGQVQSIVMPPTEKSSFCKPPQNIVEERSESESPDDLRHMNSQDLVLPSGFNGGGYNPIDDELLIDVRQSSHRLGGTEESPSERPLIKHIKGTNCKCKMTPIMIVDDNIFNLETLKMMIRERFGFEPLTAMNGQQALEIFKTRLEAALDPEKLKEEHSEVNCQRKFIHLIFMDLNMPVMDGFDSSAQILKFQEQLERKALKHSLELIKCKIVALTAFVDQINIERCTKIGMTQVLNKPAKSETIVQTLNSQCPLLKNFMPMPVIKKSTSMEVSSTSSQIFSKKPHKSRKQSSSNVIQPSYGSKKTSNSSLRRTSSKQEI